MRDGKHWYIILSDEEVMCPMVTFSAGSKTIVLDYKGINVKIRIHNFKQGYEEAKNGVPTIAYAISPRNRNAGKPIKIVFK